MDALMDRSRGNQICHSMDDFQAQVGAYVASRCSPTRADHISMSLELRPQTVFHLTADVESGLPDGGDPTQIQHQQVTRTVAASETITNQPTDDPALQQSVAKHIISKLGLVEGSTWTIREVTRGNQGWIFFYICTGSMEAWTRANAKRSDKPVIAGYSSGPGSYDPINIARPGFDCRGTLNIAFSSTSRAIIVKYEHTPLHRTVSQLLDLIAPAIPPPVNQTPNNFRAPKAKRPRPSEGGEGSARKKRPKKQKDVDVAASDAATSGEATPITTEAPDPASTQNTHSTLNPHPGVPPEVSQLATALNIPPAEAERRRNTAMDLLSSKGIDPATLSTEQMNIFANQAPQLQEASLEMLAKYGAERLRIVHPESKGQENSPSSTQSTPQPQQNPIGDSQASAESSTPNTQTTETPSKKKRNNKKKEAVSNGSTELSIGDGAVVAVGQNGTVGTTASSLKPARARKTRGACDTCKQRKAKCTKQHPECVVCQQDGTQCVYSAPKPRVRKSEVSAAIVQNDDDDQSQQADPEPNQHSNHHPHSSAPARVPEPPVPVVVPAQEPEPKLETEEPDQEPDSDAEPEHHHHIPGPAMHMSHPVAAHDPDNDEFIPDPNILSGPVDDAPAVPQQTMHNYQQPASTGFTFPPLPQASSSQSHADTTTPALTFPPATNQNNQGHMTQAQGLTLPPTNQQPRMHQAATMNNPQPTGSSTSTHRRGDSSQSSAGHSLPSAAQPRPSQALPPQRPAQVPAGAHQWNAAASAVQASSRSPATQNSASRRPASRKSAGAEAQKQARDSMHQAAAALTQAASQARTQNVSAMSKSPRQTTARTKSRQGHRSQSNTPMTNASISQPPTQQSTTHQTTANSTSNYDHYGRYNPSSNQTPAVAADSSSSRVAYESNPYGNNPRSNATSDSYTVTPAYDYSRDTGTSNPLAQALNPNTGYSANNNASNQWASSSQSRNPPTTASNPYMTGSNSNSSQGYETRTNSRPAAPTPMYSQAPQQSYPSYAAPDPTASHTQQQQQQQQQPGWYGMSTASNSNQSNYNNRNSGYGTMQPATHTSGFQSQRNISYGGHGYGNSDEQSIYELLRSGNPGH